VRVVVVAEYFPRPRDPVLGVWALRQAVAARDAGADVRVVVLDRPASRGELRDWARGLGRREAEGLEVEHVPLLAPPPRSRTYGSWGAFAAPALRRALRRAPYDLVHAHYAVPAGDAVRRLGAPYVVSDHGGDTRWTAKRWPEAVRRGFAEARLVLTNSAGSARLAEAAGARRTRVVHLGTDVPCAPIPRAPRPTIATVAHLVPRKRHEDVLHALAELPDVRWVVVGDGPERGRLEVLARELGVADRVTFTGQLPPEEARRHARTAWAFVLPSEDEAFGVAYVEAMAAGLPAVGVRGEAGPEELGGGVVLVPPRDPRALAAELRELLGDEDLRRELGAEAREVVLERFTWERCGRETVRAYEDALA
jgi:teichuronic acid biosynthesis glycosyltransferase TuaC